MPGKWLRSLAEDSLGRVGLEEPSGCLDGESKPGEGTEPDPSDQQEWVVKPG